jgi:hypothetical protein
MRCSEEHGHQRRRAPPQKAAPTAPPPPRRRRQATLQTLRYVHTANRGSPILPLPEQQTEGEESADSTAARWEEGGAQIASLNCSWVRVDVQGYVCFSTFACLPMLVVVGELNVEYHG